MERSEIRDHKFIRTRWRAGALVATGPFGGGGAGVGGAIFNQGSLTLWNASLISNTAQGGATNGAPKFCAGGMG
jgi:hypothetical protein